MIRYRCTVSDDGFEDVVIPIRSFQMRLRNSPNQCYLNVVVPSILDYATEISDRVDGMCKLERIDTDDGGNETVTELLEANIHDLRQDIGALNRSGSIMGYRQITFSDTSEVTVPKVHSRTSSEGVRRYRASPVSALKPNSVADIDGDSVSIGEIAWTVSANTNGITQTMDIRELV